MLDLPMVLSSLACPALQFCYYQTKLFLLVKQMTFIFKVNILKCSLKNTDVNNRPDGRISMNLVLERCCTLSSKKGREQQTPQFKNAVASSEPNIIEIYIQPSQVMREKKRIYLNEVCIFVRMTIISSQ